LAEAVLQMKEHPSFLNNASVSALSEELGESETLRAKRQDALRTLLETPLPDRVRHLWRYTDAKKLIPRRSSSSASLKGLQNEPPVPHGGALILISPQGRPQVALSHEAEKAGLRVLPLAEARDAEGLVGSVVPPTLGLFEAMSAAGWSSGVFVGVPKNVDLPGPVHIVLSAQAGAFLPRVLFRCGELSRATIVEEHVGTGDLVQVISVTEVIVDEGAQAQHVLLQRLNEGSTGHFTTRGRLAQNANLATILASFGGTEIKMDLGAILAGPGARSEIVGFVLGEGRQRMDHHTVHDHRAPHTSSNIDFKVVLTDRARSAYTGLIRIEEKMAGSEAFQENRNLLLSETARADTIPELEILTDDVQCSHGATVSPMDPEQVFYLESRGLPWREAERLIVRGFLEETISRVPDGLREPFEEIVQERIKHFLHGRE